MNKLFKLIFALSSAALIALTGCDAGNSPTPTPTPQPDAPVVSIKNLSVNTDGKPCTLEGGALNYTVRVTTDKITVQVEPEPKDAEVSIQGVKGDNMDINLKIGETTIPIIVSKGGVSQTYELTAVYTDPFVGIKAVKVKAGESEIDATFNAATNSYSCSVTKKAAAVTVVPNDAKAAVFIDGKQTKTTQLTFEKFGETKKLKLAIKSSSHADAAYELSVTCTNPNLNAPYLKSLKLKAGGQEIALSPAFTPTGTSYAAFVPADVTAVTVEADPAEGILVRNGTGAHTLKDGKNAIEVETAVVDAENTNFTYTITVTKAKAGASSDASLKSLKLIPKWLGLSGTSYFTQRPQEFAPDRLEYECEISPRCDQFVITAVPNAEGAVIFVKAKSGLSELTAGKEKVFAGKDFQFGLNTFEISVTAPDARAKKTYKVKVTKTQGSVELVEFTGGGLGNFFSTYKPGVAAQSRNFEAWIDKDATETTITAKPQFPENSTVTLKVEKEGTPVTLSAPSYAHKVTLAESGNTLIVVEVKSKVLPLPATFNLNIRKGTGGRGEARLKTLELSHYVGVSFRQVRLDDTFSSDTFKYTAKVPSYVKDVLVKADPIDPNAKITGWGGSTASYFFDLPKSSTQNIEVVAPNGTKQVYQLTIEKYEPAEIKINVPKNTTIDVQQYLADGYPISGTFTNPESRITSVYVGASALPIAEQFKKWVKANATASTFTANFEAIKDLPNGERDIMVIGYDVSYIPVAVATVPVTITGNPTKTANINAVLTVEHNKNVLETLPEECTLDIFVYDYSERYTRAGETVIYSRQDNVPVSRLPMTIPLAGVPVGAGCKVQVAITSKQTGHRLYYGVSETEVRVGSSGSTTAPLTARKVQ